jgi:sec-independent protein translocase protein TatA
MSIGIWQIAIVVILVVLLFGRGKISSLMGDVAKGIKSFKKGMATDVTDEPEPKNVSENNTDVTDEQEPKNVSENNQDIKDKE